MAEQDTLMQVMDSEGLVALFRQTIRLMARAHHHHDPSHHAQWRVLSLVKERGSINQSELLEMLDVRSSSLSEVLAKLERHGLISRERDATDKRSYVISATEQAKALSAEHMARRRENAERLFAGLTAAQRDQLGQILQKLVVSLQDVRPSWDGRFGLHRWEHSPCGHGVRRKRERGRRDDATQD